MLISLVVAYCILGSYAFAYLEAENERNVCRFIVYFFFSLMASFPYVIIEMFTVVFYLFGR